MTTLLIYIPFVHPMSIFNDYWYLLLVPLAFGIAIIYKALYMTTLEHFWRNVIIMTVLIVVLMAAAAFALILFIQYGIPFFSTY